jgi:tRNA 2-thiouridine synthesizing protein E
MAPVVGITGGLTDEHWCIITFIRNKYSETGECPMVHEIGKHCNLKLADLKRLFPTGYLRGACKLAGLTYGEEQVHSSWLPVQRLKKVSRPLPERVYRVNYRGFLVEPAEWDEEYAIFKAKEMKMHDLTPKHWQVIRFLRDQYEKTQTIPTVYETCEKNQLELEDLGKLFPDGYHRGAVKLSGLRQR